jgi:hypothetical protein
MTDRITLFYGMKDFNFDERTKRLNLYHQELCILPIVIKVDLCYKRGAQISMGHNTALMKNFN